LGIYKPLQSSLGSLKRAPTSAIPHDPHWKTQRTGSDGTTLEFSRVNYELQNVKDQFGGVFRTI
jgi:hypothetical protein